MYMKMGGKMATATARIVVQVTTQEKKAIGSRARRLGMNVSELMREAAQRFTPPDEDSEVLALVERVNASTQEANAALDDALSFIEESNKRIAAMNQGAR